MEVAGSGFKTLCKVNRIKSSGVSVPSPSVTIPASPFMQKFGCGTGVSVYLMKRSPKGLSHSPWAVKKISKQCDKSSKNLFEQSLNEEAKNLKALKHPNIVGYRAFTKSKDGSLCLAMEYGGKKSLYDLIEERKEKHLGPFPAEIILKVALNMARGLHNEKKILHGDIKSSNVVVNGDFESIKVCDVGGSLHLDENMTMSDLNAYYIGTESWKPREALEDDGIITDKSDVFAYGLTLWEMMTLSIPHVNLPPEGDDED
ncbi:lymphokine-activated killer T-cell-originated protein kinase-like [Pelobates fuscus]|uniref:lymphokine-activated killer T-cell-originated protein kinase-like n=1 Tax=Pelobates fuscus TaxID=191477 RepID=UPI002FE4ABA8